MRADQFAAPEEAIAALQRQRNLKLALVLGGLITAIVAMVGASALMYGDDDDYTTNPAQQR